LRQAGGGRRPWLGGCWWTGAARRRAGTGRGAVGWRSRSSPQERCVAAEPISPWWLPLDRRSCRGGESAGPLAVLRAPTGWWHRAVAGDWARGRPARPPGLGSPSRSSPSFLSSLRVGTAEDRLEGRWRPPLGLAPFPGPPPVPGWGTRGRGGAPGSLASPRFTCGSSCFAGAAGCVATLLHDAAMNPAEGNSGPGLPGRGGSGAARAARVPSAGRRVFSSPLAPREDPLGASGRGSGWGAQWLPVTEGVGRRGQFWGTQQTPAWEEPEGHRPFPRGFGWGQLPGAGEKARSVLLKSFRACGDWALWWGDLGQRWYGSGFCAQEESGKNGVQKARWRSREEGDLVLRGVWKRLICLSLARVKKAEGVCNQSLGTWWEKEE